jgi:FkbH-like protein
VNVGIIADFNSQNLLAILSKYAKALGVQCYAAPYAQSLATLVEKNAEFWCQQPQTVLVWTFPQLVSTEFNRALAFDRFSAEQLMAEVDEFADLVISGTNNVPLVLVPTWTLPWAERGWGVLDFKERMGIANILARMNLRLADRLSSDSRILIFDSERWIRVAGAEAYNARLWYRSKTPFSNVVFEEASRDIVAAIGGVRGHAKKIVVLDLDDTLWGGIVGEVGWQNIRLGGHDATGEAFVDFQRTLKRLAQRGVLLAIASKNDESVAIEAITRHPEMVLRPDDFAGWKINWSDKAQNIAELLAGLNLGIDSAVFLDDSEFERVRAREALPNLLVPDFPAEPMCYAAFLRSLRCFDTSVISSEDRARTSMYVAERKRTTLKGELPSLDAWLQRLELKVCVEPIGNENLERAAQLLNRTNQMNLRTRRLSVHEFATWAAQPHRRAWTFRVSDRFGDYGLCGVASIETNGESARLIDFLLSCRVMGRGVEAAMLATVARSGANQGCSHLDAEFIPTSKNAPCQRWLLEHASSSSSNMFSFDLSKAVVLPAHIQLQTVTA